MTLYDGTMVPVWQAALTGSVKIIMLSTTNPNPTERLFRAGGALRDFAVPINHKPGAAPVSIDEPCYSCSSAASFNSVREPEIHFAYKSC